MEPLKQKISDPNYANATCSGLDQFFSQTSAAGESSQPFNTNCSITTSDVLEAADLLDFWCNNQEPFNIKSEGHTIEASEILGYATTEPDSAGNAVSGTPLPDMTIAEAADLLELDRPSILELITSGRLTAAKDSQGRRVISRDSILDWLRSQSTAKSQNNKPAAPAPEPPAAESIPVSHPPAMDAAVFITKLQEAQAQLQAATYRIGYLEQEIEDCRQQLKLLPDMQAQADRLAQVEKENEELRRSWPKLQAKIGRLKELESENAELRQLLEEQSYRSGGLWSSLKSMIFGSRRSRERSAPRSYGDVYETPSSSRFR